MERIKFWRVVASLLLCSLSTQTYAQTPQQRMSMTLEECLEYAKENSITLHQAKLDIDDSKADELSAKGSFLPTISGVVGQDFNTNPLNMDPSASKSSYSGSYGLNLSMTLYNGGENRSQLKQSQLSSRISSLQLDEFEDSIEVSVTETYINILYAMEQIVAAESSLELSMKNEERGAAYLEVGSINAADFAQLQSATASYRYSLITAQTALSNLYVQLKHLLEISYDVNFEIVEPELSKELLMEYIPMLSDVYNSALDTRPEIEASKLSVESAELSEKIAKANYLPTLSLSAGTGFSHNTSSAYDLTGQLRNNYNSSAGITLSVPIFNGFSTKSSVRKAQNSVKYAALTLSQAEKDLYKTIETLHNNATTSQSKYMVSEYQLTANLKSLELTNDQFDLGMKNTIELLTEQDNYNQAYQEYLVNKYQLILNKALLNYYKTNIIKL